MVERCADELLLCARQYLWTMVSYYDYKANLLPSSDGGNKTLKRLYPGNTFRRIVNGLSDAFTVLCQMPVQTSAQNVRSSPRSQNHRDQVDRD